MTDATEMHDSLMLELNNLVISDRHETKEEQEGFSFLEDTDSDEIPASLLSYFETSKSRAAACEKLILEEDEDFTTSHHTEDMMNLPVVLDKDVMKLDEQDICDPENEENNTSTDTRLLPAPTESEALFTHNVSVCPNNEDDAGTNEYMESEEYLAFETRTLEITLNEEERIKISAYEAERERRLCEETKKEEQMRQVERDFQEELRKIMEAEKLQQKELELMEKRAQEKLEQEFLLQQELISSLQRRVEEERRMREEEQKRIKEEEVKRKREEEERKRVEAETRMKKEEERKREEMKLKKEAEMKKQEEERRKREEEKWNIALEKKRLEEEMRKVEEEKRRKKEEVERMKEEEEKRKREEERKKIEEARKNLEKEKRKMEEELIVEKEEEQRKKEEKERKKKEEESMRSEEEGRVIKEMDKRKKQQETRKKKEEEERIKVEETSRREEKRMKEEKRKKEDEIGIKKQEERRKREEENVRIEEEKKVTKESEERRKQEKVRKKKEEEAHDRTKVALQKIHEEMKKRDERKYKNEDEDIKVEEKRKMEEEDGRKKEEEEKEEAVKKKMEDVREVGGKVERENRKLKEVRLTEEEEKRKKENENQTKEEDLGGRTKEMRVREDYRKPEEEMTLKEDKDGPKGGKVNNRKMERERGGKVEEEMMLKEKGGSKKRMVQDKEKEVQVRREHNMVGQNNMVQSENSSQLEDSISWTSSSSRPSHSESTICPESTEAAPRLRNLENNSRDKTVDCETRAVGPSAVCLAERAEQKRLSWMKDCVPWSKLSLQNRRKQKGSARSRRGRRRTAEADSLPPLCPDALLQAAGWKSLREVTTVTLEDLPGCSLSTLAQCTHLQSLTLRRCGLKSLESINQLPKLCYVDVQENDISYVDCENMKSLRVLRLGHNKLMSIHGLTGAENLDVLDLSCNSITRIAGLESVRRLQRLSVDHNQLISTKGLRDVYTLLHLSCSHNHLAAMEGLENSALLNTLDLRANCLTEPPSLSNQVLLRELHLDDNSISSLQGLSACWLPLMQLLSVAQNRINRLPSMSDFVSLERLDLGFNCLSELQNVCESLEGCQFLQKLHLTGNPLQQESGWRRTLQRAVPGLRVIDDQETDSPLSPPAVQQVSLAPGSFPRFCQAQLRQTRDLHQQHSRELRDASSSLDAIKTSCQQFTEALQLAAEQRFAHEYGDTTVADKHRAADQTPEETLDIDSTSALNYAGHPEMESTGKVPPIIPNEDNIRASKWTFDEESAAESRHDTLKTVTKGQKTEPTARKASSGVVHSLAAKEKTISCNLETAPKSNHQDLDLQNTAAVVIQQLWRKYRQKCGNISSLSTAEVGGGRGGDVGKAHAATVIQAFWRGFTLRRRLTSALAAVTCPDAGEDDTFEEVDVDEFVFDEVALEKPWTLPLSEDSPPRRYPVSEQPLSLKPPGPSPEPLQYILPPHLVRRSKQAWVAEDRVDCGGPRVFSVSSNRSKSPASTSAVGGLSERSEKILEEWGFTNSHTALLMLKRAQNMKSKTQQQSKRRDPSVRLALFRNCSYQPVPAEAQNRQTQHNRNERKVRQAKLGLQRAGRTERGEPERGQQRLHTQAAHSERDAESVRFLPEISSDILNGGRVQLMADPGYTSHHASGLWANSSLAAQLCNENNYPRRNSLGHAREEVPYPKRGTSAPSKKERISYRDNPVQLSGGWGGGKKRNKVYK